MKCRLMGWKQIGKYIGVHHNTAAVYHQVYGMPVDFTPTGKPCAKIDLIDDWLENSAPYLTKDVNNDNN